MSLYALELIAWIRKSRNLSCSSLSLPSPTAFPTLMHSYCKLNAAQLAHLPAISNVPPPRPLPLKLQLQHKTFAFFFPGKIPENWGSTKCLHNRRANLFCISAESSINAIWHYRQQTHTHTNTHAHSDAFIFGAIEMEFVNQFSSVIKWLAALCIGQHVWQKEREEKREKRSKVVLTLYEYHKNSLSVQGFSNALMILGECI